MSDEYGDEYARACLPSLRLSPPLVYWNWGPS
jgi:hypothetical protein